MTDAEKWAVIQEQALFEDYVVECYAQTVGATALGARTESIGRIKQIDGVYMHLRTVWERAEDTPEYGEKYRNLSDQRP